MEESAQILEIETFIPLLLQVGNLLCITNAKYWVRYELVRPTLDKKTFEVIFVVLNYSQFEENYKILVLINTIEKMTKD